MMRWTCAWAVMGLLAAGLASAEPALPDPEVMGPYPVGVTTMLLVDHSRTDAVTGKPRALLTEIWYPATDDTRNLPKNKFSDHYLRGQNPALNEGLKRAFNIDVLAMDALYENDAVRDARVRNGRFPLIVFSHGNGGMRTQNAFWTDHMASHGYIVAAPDHTGNASVTVLDGEVVPMQADRAQAAADRPLDVKFLIDAMARLDRGADSRFLGRIDMEHIGVAGHSFGGYTSARAADIDNRIDAIAPMSAVAAEREKHDVPVMLLIATEDDTIKETGNARMRTYYEESTGPRYLVEFLNAGHYSFTEMFQFNPDFGDGVGKGTRITDGSPIEYLAKDEVYRLTNGYTAAFFGKFLKGFDGYDAYLAENHAPDELIVKSGRP